jgi:hypothetical protein
MDDEAKQLLREMLDILRKDHETLMAESKRNAEWIDESRKYNDDCVFCMKSTQSSSNGK